MERLKFQGLTELERISRLEMLYEELREYISRVGAVQSSGQKTINFITNNFATRLRDCDKEPILVNENEEVRFIADFGFVSVPSDAVISVFSPDGRVGFFGMDGDGKFFVAQNSPNGEWILFMVSGEGVFMTDQYGRLGRLVVGEDGVVRFEV